MNHRRSRKIASMLALLIFAAGAVPALAAEDKNTEAAVSPGSDVSGGSPAAEQAAPEQQPAPDEEAVPEQQPAPGQSAVERAAPTVSAKSEPPPDEPAGSEPAEDNGSKPEVLQETSYNPANWLVYKPLWAASNFVGDFNPVGKYISAPLEEKFPGLRVKGFINSITQINTTSTNHSVGLGGRDKDWRLQKQEFRAQLELKYQANPNIELVNVNNFQYDGAYDFQNTDGLYTDGSSNQKYYTQGKRIIKELYVRGNYGKLNFTLGKQIVNWGKMDGKVIDIVNAEDSRDVVQYDMKDYEWRYIGQWMANVAVRPTENLTLNLLVNPDFQPNQGPAGGSPYWYPWVSSPHSTTAEKVRHGYENIKDVEIGFRADATLGALTLSGIYYYGFDRDGVYSPAEQAIIHPRQHKFGYALDYGTTLFGQRLIIRSEGLYTRGKTYNVPTAKDGLLDKDTLKLALAFETSIFSDENKIDVLYQPIWTQQISYDERTGANRREVIHVVNISHSIRKTNDKLTLSATGYIPTYSSKSGVRYNVTGGWQFNDHLKATLAYNDYLGSNTSFPFGAYNKWKNVELGLKYEW